MPTYFIVDGVKIELYYQDHNPPHFHARIAEFDAIVNIESGKIMQDHYQPTSETSSKDGPKRTGLHY